MSAPQPQQWPWQRMNESNVSAHDVLASLLDPQPGERWVDIGTGGGGLAFALARRGADVVGVDIAEDGLAHARAQAAADGLAIEFRQGDAQELPFADAELDGVASAFGVIFAPDQGRAASELARVCKPGGKLGLTLMPMESRTGAFMSLLRSYGGGPATHPASFAERVDELLGESFELDVKLRESPNLAPPPMPWDEALRSFGPLRELVERLDDERTASLRDDLERIDREYSDRKPSYHIALGRRR